MQQDRELMLFILVIKVSGISGRVAAKLGNLLELREEIAK